MPGCGALTSEGSPHCERSKQTAEGRFFGVPVEGSVATVSGPILGRAFLPGVVRSMPFGRHRSVFPT